MANVGDQDDVEVILSGAKETIGNNLSREDNPFMTARGTLVAVEGELNAEPVRCYTYWAATSSTRPSA
jgi:hypothetical protein